MKFEDLEIGQYYKVNFKNKTHYTSMNAIVEITGTDGGYSDRLIRIVQYKIVFGKERFEGYNYNSGARRRLHELNGLYDFLDNATLVDECLLKSLYL